MLDKGRINGWQLGLLLFTLVTATAFLFVPAITYANAKQDGWLSLLIPSTLYGLAVGWVCNTLALRFPRENVIEFLPKILGKFLGKLAGLIFVFWFIYVNAIIIREFGDFLLSAFLPETPLVFFNMVLVLLAASFSRNGLEVISRANEFIFPVGLITIILIMALSAGDIDLSNLQPVLEEGIRGILRGGLAPSGWRGEMVILLIFLPMLHNLGEGQKAAAYSVVAMGLLLSAVTVVTVAVFGSLTGHSVFPFLDLANYISIAGFLERVEAVVVVIWVAGVTIKVACFFHAGVLATASWFGLRDYKPLVYPIGIILLTWSITIYESSRELVYFLDAIFPSYAFFNELLLPFLILVAAWLGKKGGRPRAPETDADHS